MKLRIETTRDELVKEVEVESYKEAEDLVFDTYGCCWTIENHGDMILAYVYPECVPGFEYAD